MNSDYAYVHFTQPIKESDQTINGELVQLNSPILEGETNLMGISEYNRFQNDFPDRIKGEIIKEDNLLNVLNALYDNLGKDIENISQVDEATRTKFEQLGNTLDFVNAMESNQQSYKSEVEDLANKLYLVQNRVRAAQRSKTHQNGRSM
ncbi:unknown [Clostridium sp. CAG:417]|nr:unknown [Clostridium sp. CAG:417]